MYVVYISQFDGVTLKYVELLYHKPFPRIYLMCTDICTVYVKLCILLLKQCGPAYRKAEDFGVGKSQIQNL